MSEDDPDITDPTDVARLAFGHEDGVIWGDLTWQSYVDTHDDGTITVDVYPDTNPLGELGDIPGLRYRIEYLGHAPNPGDETTTRAQQGILRGRCTHRHRSGAVHIHTDRNDGRLELQTAIDNAPPRTVDVGPNANLLSAAVANLAPYEGRG